MIGVLSLTVVSELQNESCCTRLTSELFSAAFLALEAVLQCLDVDFDLGWRQAVRASLQADCSGFAGHGPKDDQAEAVEGFVPLVVEGVV
jgi:hypothetical protein